MKAIRVIVIALCAVMAFSACKKQVGGDKYVCPEGWVYDETKGAPIQILGKGVSLETKRGIINPVDGTLPETVHFGVFGLGVNHADPTSEEIDNPVIFKGLMGEESNALDATVYYDDIVNLYLADLRVDGYPVYYPVLSLTDYTFYGFHAGEDVDNTVLDLNEDGEYVKAIADYGYTDVLWAKASAQPFEGITGFNAKYVRAIKKADRNDLLPTFDFSHQTACFEFRIKASDEDAEESFLPENADVRIVSAVVEGLKNDATLVVCSEDPDRLGLIEEGEEDREPEVIDCGDGYYPTVDGTVIGDGFFVKAESIANIKLTVVLDQRPVANEEKNRTIVITGEQIREKFQAAYPDGDTKFEDFQAGYKYTMNIMVNEAMDIKIGVTLQEWDDTYSGNIVEIE